jgi:hypothetical protein
MLPRLKMTSNHNKRKGKAKTNKGLLILVFSVAVGLQNIRLLSIHGLNQKTGATGTVAELTMPVSNSIIPDTRLPQRPKRRVTNPTDKILVAYSGPTELVDRSTSVKNYRREHLKELYRLNFEHF